MRRLWKWAEKDGEIRLYEEGGGAIITGYYKRGVVVQGGRNMRAIAAVPMLLDLVEEYVQHGTSYDLHHKARALLDGIAEGAPQLELPPGAESRR